MSKLSKLALIKEMIDSAESSLRSAKHLLNELAGGPLSADLQSSYARAAAHLGSDVTEAGKVIEGVFDGQNMVGPDGTVYPVPANYASKSKLVPGDVLKLTIVGDGSFIYKQIGPIERKRIIGPLTREGSQYKVIAGGRAYKVLLASVTFYRAEPGDQVAILVPEVGEAEWGAVDNVIPRLQAELQAEQQIISEARGAAKDVPDESEEFSFGSLDDEEHK